MAVRKPLVLISGQPQELPSGDTVSGTPLTFPFYKSTGASDPIALVSGTHLPFFDSTGSANNIALST